MDRDPELDVTLSNGRQSATFRITPVAGAQEAWAILEPHAPLTVMVGRAGAVAARSRVDTRIAARLAAGWVPVDAGPAGAQPVPLPPDLVLQIGSVLEALGRARAALRAADPSGRLGAACDVFRRQAQRVGVAAPVARRVARAQRERRLAALAEQAGDIPAAIAHDRAAVASHAGRGVRRRLTRLDQDARPAATPPDGFATPPRARTPPADSPRLLAGIERSCGGGPPARPHPGGARMPARIQSSADCPWPCTAVSAPPRRASRSA